MSLQKPIAFIYMRTRILPLREEMRIGLNVTSLYSPLCHADIYIAVHGIPVGVKPFQESDYYRNFTYGTDRSVIDLTGITDGSESAIIVESIRFAKRARYRYVCLIHDDCYLKRPVETLDDAHSLVSNPLVKTGSVTFAAGGCTVYNCEAITEVWLDDIRKSDVKATIALMELLGYANYRNVGLALDERFYIHKQGETFDR